MKVLLSHRVSLVVGMVSVLTVLAVAGLKPAFSWIQRLEHRMLFRQIEKESTDAKRQLLLAKLTRQLGPKETLDLLNDSQIPRSGDLHLLGHVVGSVAYDLYKEDALPYCQNDMFNGCTHGLLLSAVSDIGFDGVKRMVENCKKYSVFQYHMCLHGAGHAFLTLASYDIFPALVNCDDLVDLSKSESIHCYNGVFMENALGEHDGLTPPLHPWLSTTDLLKPCNSVEDRYKQACYFNQASWWVWVFQQDVVQTAKQCQQVPVAYFDECADSVGRAIAPYVGDDVEKIKQGCGQLGLSGGDVCMSVIAKAMFAVGNTALPFELCRSVSQDGKNICYQDLVLLFKEQGLEQKKITQYCEKFEKDFVALCPH